MCGIVGAVSKREVAPILIEGLKRLEYRGYDSAGLSTVEDGSGLTQMREVGKVIGLEAIVAESEINGKLGIAHTRRHMENPQKIMLIPMFLKMFRLFIME